MICLQRWVVCRGTSSRSVPSARHVDVDRDARVDQMSARKEVAKQQIPAVEARGTS